MQKTAVISGVGPGLGASLVRKFASEGYQVGLLARSPNYIQMLAAELEASGTKALALPTDIADSQMVETSFNTIHEELGGVDVLINHAGYAAWGEFDELTAEAFHRSWQVCAFGSFLCTQQVVPDMIEKGSGAILFTGATSAIRGRAGAIAFSSAKFAMRGLAWALARKWDQRGFTSPILSLMVLSTHRASVSVTSWRKMNHCCCLMILLKHIGVWYNNLRVHGHLS